MRIFFIGTVLFSHKTLEKLIQMGEHIVGVATKKTSDFNADFVSLHSLCEKNNIPYQFVKNINDEQTLNWIAGLNPDVIFCFGWSSLLKTQLLKLPPLGVVGFHPAKLPSNRGRHPIIWALALGLNETASTFFYMDEGADSGDIISQELISINKNDTANDLYYKIISVALIQLEEFVPKLNNYCGIPQIHEQANYWRKRSKKDGKIDFRMSSHAIYNLVRALTKPYVGAHICYNDEEIKIWQVESMKNTHHNIEFGKVLESKDSYFIVKTMDGAIKIIDHEFKVLPKVGEYL